MERAAQSHRDISDKEAESAQLLELLGKSLELGKLWPGLWELRKANGGVVTSGWTRAQHVLTMRVTVWGPGQRGIIESRDFPRPSVPESLRNPIAETETLDWLGRYARQKVKAFKAGRI